MRIFLLFIFIILLSNCTTIEVAKEITKASKSIKTSVDNIMKSPDDKIAEENTTDKQVMNQEIANLEKEKKEKEKIITEQKKRN